MLAMLCVLPAIAAQAQDQDRPRRVVTMHLCADQLALLLLERERIASLSYNAANPEFSAMADSVGDIPLNYGRAEEVIAFDPDLIIAGQHAAAHRIRLMRQLGYKVLAIPTVASLDQARAQIRHVAGALGVPERGETVVAELERLLERAKPADGRKPLAAVFHFSSQTIGGNSLVDDVLAVAGYRNMAKEMGIRHYGHLPLERLLKGQPDLLVFEGARADYPAVGRAVLRHPALQQFLDHAESVTVPSNLWSCPTPHIGLAALKLAAARP